MVTCPDEKLTPLMRQYHEIKRQYSEHGQTLLLFQVGDFYELFFDDAKQAAACLGIALTKRGNCNGEPIPLCGVPLHALDHYLPKLIKAGFRVALCDQLEEPVPGKVVKRGVTQVLTPGMLTDTKLLDAKSASYLMSFFPTQDSWALLFGELLTGQLFATTVPNSMYRQLETELSRFFPDEIIVPQQASKEFQPYFKRLGYFTTIEQLAVLSEQQKQELDNWLRTQFNELVYQQIQKIESLRLALATFYAYVNKNQHQALREFKHLHVYKPEDFLLLDSATQRNLELVKNNYDGSKKHTLFEVLDKAVTPMGSRMIKKWLLRPLIAREAITQRFEVVHEFVHNVAFMQKLQELLAEIGDIERVVGRIALARAVVADYIMLKRVLALVPAIKQLLDTKTNLALLQVISLHCVDLSVLHKLLHDALHDGELNDWIIKAGFHAELDRVRELVNGSSQKILAFELKEQQATGIPSLKVRYNQVQGYYIELTKLAARAVPEYYIRQQTLANKERFMTQELKILQDEILRARFEIEQLEKKVFEEVKATVAGYTSQLRKLAHGLAYLDALLGFSSCAYEYGYVCPEFNESRDIVIEDGRHPVIEGCLSSGFIPNSTALSDNASLWIITGPNMGGKSTYLRQVALICILAQCGSFIPAKSAKLALLDRIFTRIGAGDYLAGGKSTFLVEMEETALICTQATEKSLVILDEVGRGTSTFDGLAIAQAVIEYIFTQVKARCLFATHYHELTDLQHDFPGIESYYAASKKTEQGIVFLYKMVKGVADGSFGIEVARLAELPESIIARAKVILQEIDQYKHHEHTSHEKDQCRDHDKNSFMPVIRAQQGVDAEKIVSVEQEQEQLRQQLTAVQSKLLKQDEVLSLLKTLDYENLSPKQALDILWRIKEQDF